MVRRDGSIKYDEAQLKVMRKRLLRNDIDLTLVETTALPYTYETHKLNAKTNLVTKKRLRQAIAGLLENSCPGMEKKLCYTLIDIGWLISLEDTQCVRPKNKKSTERCAGTYKLANKKSMLDGVIWRCRVCTKYQYIRKGAHLFFKLHNKVPLGTLVKVCVGFLLETPASDMMMTLDLREATVRDVYKTLRHLVIKGYAPQKLGGNGLVVEMDEMYWIRRIKTFKREPRVKRTYLLFGAIERASGKIGVRLMFDREAQTIERHTQDLVNEQSIVFTDSYAGYGRLSGMGYYHYHLIKPSYVDTRPEKTEKKVYHRQRLQIKKLPTADQEMKVDLAEIARRKSGLNLSVYSSTAGIENVWKYFRKFYRSRGRISCDTSDMENAIIEFQWRYNNKGDIFNTFASLLQPEMTDLLSFFSETRVKASVREAKKASAQRSNERRKAAKEIVKDYLTQIKLVAEWVSATPIDQILEILARPKTTQ
jgi:hypothetical protein